MNYAETLTHLKPGHPLVVEFLMLPGASLLSFASTVDPLRAANRLAGRLIFDWRLVSPDGGPIMLSGRVPVPVQGQFDPYRSRDLFGVIAGFNASDQRDRRLNLNVFRAARAAALCIGIESGGWVLARAGLLDGRAATTHWEDFEDFAAAFPLVDLRPDRFVTDGPFLTTSGASPSFDLMIEIVRHRAGQSIALNTAGVFLHDVAHRPGDRQTPVALARPGRFDPRVVQAVALMQARLDDPVPIAQIAKAVHLSLRGFEMLFKQQIGEPPGRYYQSLRLGAARKILLDTALPIVEIAFRTGFSSVAAFSRAYRQGYGTSPSADRKAARRT